MRRADFATAAACLLAGCGGLPLLLQPERPMFRDARLAPQAAIATLATGRSTRADVGAQLGEADRVAFENGHEVWIYRSHPVRPGQAELVLLFGPDGVLKKLRAKDEAR